MRVSWNWLQDFIDLTGLTPQQVADKLTMSGMEVEGLHEVGSELNGVVLARVVSCVPHPGADALSLTQVDVGGDELVQVVCGAPNVAEGVFAPLATVGTTMPSAPGDAPFKIKKAKIRGEASFGMLCSSKELLIAEDSDGLLLFDAPTFAAGTPIAEVLGLQDWVIEIGLTPNRPDGLSIRGVAREIAALFERPWKELAVTGPADSGSPRAEDRVSVEIADADGCPRYAAAVIDGVVVGPSPDWLQQRLLAVGQRPVNNLVDVTNYILMEQGQPLHAFDLAKVQGSAIVVRRAAAGESIRALDGTEHALEANDLVIADAKAPSAIAGVMGGADSEIRDETTSILIECANFEPSTVRRTARRLGMHTESSHRFERGVDRERIAEVLRRAVDLVLETQVALGASCTVAAGILDVYPTPYVAPVVVMASDLPTRLLGVEINAEASVEILNRLGIVSSVSGDEITARIPAYRPDLTRPIDLVEEVGRVFGYENIPSTPLPGDVGLTHVRREDTPPRTQENQPVRTTAEILRADGLRNALTGLGVSEAVNWSFGDTERQGLFAEGPYLRLRNPLGEERSVMRKSLWPGLLGNVAHNLAHGAPGVALFELGRVYPTFESVPDENVEPLRLTGVFAGTVDDDWSRPARALDGHDVVGLLQRALTATGVNATVARGDAPAWAHPGVSASVQIGKKSVGWVGRLHPDVLDTFGVSVPVFGFDVAIGDLWAKPAGVPQHKTIARTPAAWRDVALVMDAQIPYGELSSCIDGFKHAHLESVALFDVYAGKGLEPGTKSVALRVVYRDPAGTLTDAQVDKLTAKFLRHVERGVGATLRS